MLHDPSGPVGEPTEVEHDRKASILVVDDQAANRELVRFTLEDEGHRVLLASSGAEGLAIWERERPEIVLLDIRMPDMSGFEVCERMRERPGGSETPVIFVTALREVDAFDAAQRAGAADFLTKPVKPAELLMRVEAALTFRRLRDERRDLYALLKRQRDDQTRLVLQKERLTAFLVHDLKNPVSGMQLATDLILRDPEATPKIREAAARIAQEGRRLQRMILDLLDISKADEGMLSPSKAQVDLEELASELFEALKLRASGREVSLRSELSAPSALADRELLRRILENFLENAIRHAPRRSEVTLCSKTSEGGVIISVADAGSGVPEALKASVFDRFVQGRGESRSGQGLGLAFCKLAVEAHGGRIWLDDAPQGAVFRIWLPQP